MVAGVRVEAGDECVVCHGSGIATKPIELRTGYLQGAAPSASLMLLEVRGSAGLGADDDGDAFARRHVLTEHQAVREMPDGLLQEHLTRLRRQLVMAREDNLTDWALEWTRERFDIADREWRWRQRAADKGGTQVDRSAQWRERVEKVKASIDLAMLIAYECDGAKPAGLGKWQCRCPFHLDNSPSMSIDVAKGLWHCHGCGVGGDAFTYAEMRYGLDFAGAVRHLEQRL